MSPIESTESDENSAAVSVAERNADAIIALKTLELKQISAKRKLKTKKERILIAVLLKKI